MASKSSKIVVFFGFILLCILILDHVTNLPRNIVFKLYFTSKFKERQVTDRKLYIDYLRRFNKSYGANEFFKRFRYFKKSLKEIERQNDGTDTATYGLTMFSDWSSRELARMLSPLGGCESRASNCSLPSSAEHSVPRDERFRIRIPKDAKKVDWREHDAVGPVLNQKNCPVCWAYSIAGVMESMSVIQNSSRPFKRLSIQELIDCAYYTPPGKTGCSKGQAVIKVFEYLCNEATTLATEADYPLSYADEDCKGIGGARSLKRFDNNCDMYLDEEKLVEWLQHGPVTASVNALLLLNYISGVIREHCEVPDQKHLNHAVQIVGYDKTDPKLPYYIVRNSWGDDWGEGGYVRLAIGGNQCGIAYSVEIAYNTMVQLIEHKSNLSSFNKEPIRQFTWHAASGVSVTVMSFGAIIQSVKVPDKNGELADVALGFDTVDDYINRNTPSFGAAVGRCANRIAGAAFQIDGVTYTLAKNVGNNHLHGGIMGFSKVNWTTTVDGNKVIFSYLSKDGEEGYPGDLLTNITYELTADGQFLVDFMATTTKKTVVNLTNHSYFNLAGHDGGTQEMFEHEVMVVADKITETDHESIPTGRLTNVGGTAFDLRTPKRLGDIISKNPMLFDNNFCITSFGKQNLRFISRVIHPPSGRYLEVYTDQPGVQLYTSYNLPAPTDPALIGKDGVGYRRHGGFCLETQNYPDAVHHENFPSPILKPGDIYRHKVVYVFGVELCHGSEPTVVAS